MTKDTNRGTLWPLLTTAELAPWLFGLAFDAPLVGVLVRWPNKLHAITLDGVVAGAFRGTFESACGMRGLRLSKAQAGDQRIAAPWPPRLKGMPSDMERCRICWIETGRRRPRCEWKAAA